MSEATVNIPVETVETVNPEPEKPYKFRLLGAPDVFLMAKIIKAIGINEFMAALNGDSLKGIVKAFKAKQEGGGADNSDMLAYMGAIAGSLEIANVIIGNLPRCENEIYHLLANTSNLTVDEIKAPGNAVMFFEMVIDFIKKEEFRDFIKVVSKLFK